MITLRRRGWFVLAVVPALIAATAIPAFASHFRASNTALSYSNGVLTWDINSAWRKTSPAQVIYSAGNVAVTDGGGSPAPGVVVTDPVSQLDTSNPAVRGQQ